MPDNAVLRRATGMPGRLGRLVQGALGLGALVLGAVVLGAPADASAHAAAPPAVRTLCTLQDKRIDEASGLARGIVSPAVLYAQNDSGDTNRVFALDARTCATAAVITIGGARNVDWEDLAIAPDAAGTPSLWVADIGDNDARRGDVQIYRVDEPRIDPAWRDRAVRAGPADVWNLRYASGPVNAESFAVTPRGVGYAITKSTTGRSVVYRLPPRPGAGVQVWQRVAALRLRPTTTAGALGAGFSVLATSAAISRDGTVLAVRTYTDAYLWRVRGDDVAAALREPPQHLALPLQRQGEGIAIDGNRLLLDSEHKHTAVLAVPFAPARNPAARSNAATNAATSTASSPAKSAPAAGAQRHAGTWTVGIVLLTLLVVGSVAWWVAQLRDGRRR